LLHLMYLHFIVFTKLRGFYRETVEMHSLLKLVKGL